MTRWTLITALAFLPAMACAQPEPQPNAARPVLLIGNKGEDAVSFVSLATGKELGRSPAKTRAKVREIAVSGGPQARQVTILFSPDGRRIYA